jgi:hypothetical protein
MLRAIRRFGRSWCYLRGKLGGCFWKPYLKQTVSSLALMMEAVSNSGTLVNFCGNTRHNSPVDSPLHTRRRENLKFSVGIISTITRSLPWWHVCIGIEQFERTETLNKANRDRKKSRSTDWGRPRSVALWQAIRQSVFDARPVCLTNLLAAMSRTLLVLFVCLTVLPAIVIPARYVPKWKKQVSPSFLRSTMRTPSVFSFIIL